MNADENIIESINILKIKNIEYVQQLRSINSATQDRMIDFEGYQVLSGFGNQVIDTIMVSPDVAQIASKESKEIYRKIRENCVEIENLARSLRPIEMSDQEVAAFRQSVFGGTP